MARLALVTFGGLWIALASCASRPDAAGRSAEAASATAEESGGDNSAADSPEFSFTVVDGRSGKPVSEAEVLWEQDPTDGSDALYGVGFLEAWSAMMRPDLDLLESRLTEHGHRVRSDAGGRVVLPGSELPSVFCRRGALIGSTGSLDSEQNAGWKLRLWPDGDLRVQVIDASGHPFAGAGVMLVSSDEAHLYPTAELRATTNSDGLAVLPHAWPRITSDRTDPGQRRSWQIAVESLPEGAALYELDPTSLPRKPITIRMPPSGEVEIEVRELDGSPASVDLPIGLREVDAESLEWSSRGNLSISQRQRTDELRTKLVDGKARLAHVAPGLELIAYAARNEASRVHVIRFAGPKRLGEIVRSAIVLGADSVILAGCLKGADGVALADARVRISLYGAPSPDRDMSYNTFDGQALDGRNGTLTTDVSGRFIVEFATDAAFHGRPVLVIAYRNRDGVELAKRVELQDVWSVGQHDIGDIPLGDVPIMAAGVVVDESGAPISGAWLSVVRGGLHSGHDFETNERGEFEWRSAEPHDTVRLNVRKEGFFDLSPLSFAEVGRTDWRIVLQKSSSILGRVLLPVGSDYRDFGYSMRRLETNSDGGSASAGGNIESDGTFAWKDCNQGTYSLTVYSVREGEISPLQLDRIEVRKGQTVDLGNLDLRDASRPVKLRVVAPDGSLVAGCFTYGPRGSNLIEEMRTRLSPREFSKGQVTLRRNGEEDLDIAISVPGLRTKIFHEVHDGDVLRMERGLRLRIALKKGVSKPPEGQRLLLGLFPQDADQRAIVIKGPRWPTKAFDPHGEVELLAPAPGSYRLRWILECGAGRQIESRYWQEPPQSIELTDSRGLQRFEVVCPIDPATAWTMD